MIRNFTFICAWALPLLSTTTLAAYEYGINVSKWQGVIDFPQVYDTGISFAFVKATENTDETDPKFQYNITNATAVGLKTGVYHRARPTTDANDVINEARNFVSVAGDYMTEGHIRPVLDLECGKEMGKAALSAWAWDFLLEVEWLTNFKTLIYCNTYYADSFMDDSLSVNTAATSVPEPEVFYYWGCLPGSQECDAVTRLPSTTYPLKKSQRSVEMRCHVKPARRPLRLEFLESRQMLSGTAVAEVATVSTTPANVTPASTLVLPYAETVGAQPDGSLSGKIVYTSAGHGYTAANTGSGSWSFQRSEKYGMIEDLGNQDQMTMYVDYLFRAGATVVPMRPVGHQVNEVVLDNDSSGVTWHGSWSNSSSSVYYGSVGDVPYRYANTSTTETAYAIYRPNIPEAGKYPVYTWASAGSNRASDQLYVIHHAGGDAEVTINHQAVGGGLVYLGTYYFEAGTEGYVKISNQSNDSGKVVIADAIRFGNGMGDIDRGGGVSGLPREDEAALYWIMAQVGQGTSSSAYRQFTSDRDSSIRAPVMWAEHMNREAALNMTDRVYLGFHSNASSGSARGAMALYNKAGINNKPTPNQYNWAAIVDDEVTLDMQASGPPLLEYDWTATNRSPYCSQYGFGEIDNRVIDDEFDATIIEIAFHDNQTDARLMLDPDMRDLAARACYQATVKYFEQFDSGSDDTLLPDPVTNAMAVGNSNGTITVSWDAPVVTSTGGDATTGYLVYKSTDGTGYDGGTYVPGFSGTSVTFNDLPDAEGTYYFRVAACNDGGVSAMSDVVVASPAGTSVDSILIVNGFDRQDRHLTPDVTYGSATVSRVRPDYTNSHTYATQVGQALEAQAGKIAISSVQNDAIISGEVNLSDYQMVVWILGEESTADDTFNTTEQAKVSSYLAGGGNLFVSGAEIGYELTGTSFYSNTLKATYVRDDAAAYNAQGTSTGIFAGINLTFDDGDLFYDTNYPDVISPGSGAQAALSYVGGTGGTAAIQYEGTGSQGSLVMLGFPFETITSATTRSTMMIRMIDFFEVGISVANEAPIACTDYYSVHVSDTLDIAASGVLANDSDEDNDTLTAIQISSPNNGTLNFSSTGAFTYNPDPSYLGWDSFTYKAFDGTDTSNLATVAINVYNNAPSVVDDTYTLNMVPIFEANMATGIIQNDNDIDGDSFSVFVQDDVEHGTLNLNTDGSFTYVPQTGFSGTDQFTYYATDGWDTSAIATVTFQIQAYAVPGDANGDGKVDGSDVTILANNWQLGVNGTTQAAWSQGDFNADGKVDGSDVTFLANNWQSGVNSTVVAVSGSEEEEESGTTRDSMPTTQFVPPANASLDVATVPQRKSLLPRRLIIPTFESTTAVTEITTAEVPSVVVETATVAKAIPAMATDAVLAEFTWSESDYTSVAKDLVVVSTKQSTTTKNELLTLKVDPYADLD